MSNVIKLSSPATKEFWEIPVLFEDEHLLALDKPIRLHASPDRYDPERPNLMELLHRDIERGASWVRERQIDYLMYAHQLDFEASGVLLLAKSKPILIKLADQFGEEKPVKNYLTLAQGTPESERFEANFKLAPHPDKPGLQRVDDRQGKRARTEFEVSERFSRYTLLRCRPAVGRIHQIRVHLQRLRLPVAGDSLYGGRPLLLSSLKAGYRFKPDQPEKPLIDRAALHAVALDLTHPASGLPVHIEAPLPKDLTVALKYLRRFAVV